MSAKALESTQQASILVEKRTYKPAGWVKLREVTAPCRITPKRVYTYGRVLAVFDRETGRQVQPRLHAIGQSIRYTLQSTFQVKP